MASSRCGGFTSYSIPREKCNLSRTLRELSNLNDYGKTSAEEISNTVIEGISYVQVSNCTKRFDNTESTLDSAELIYIKKKENTEKCCRVLFSLNEYQIIAEFIK